MKEERKQQFPRFDENISNLPHARRHPGRNSNDLTDQNLVKIQEEKKVTREKFEGIKYLLG